MDNKVVQVNGESLTIEDVCLVAKGAKVALPAASDYWRKIDEARSFLIEYIKSGVPTYGVTTDFGDSCANQISVEKSGELQRVIVKYHGIGLGHKFSVEEGRAIVLCRLNSNAKGGYSAVRPALLRALESLINHDIIPIIPEIGSVGASGDLTPLSYLAAVIMGERKVYYKGKKRKAADALKEEGLSPLPLQAKEGLALMNGTSVMTAIAALSVHDCEKLAQISDFLTAVTSEILRGKDTPFLPQVHTIKNHGGECASGQYINAIISNSKRVYRYEDFLDTQISKMEQSTFKVQSSKIQDRYSVRCAPQVNGVFRDTLTMARQWVSEELNSANDNPLVDISSQKMLNTGNFYGGHICAACDYLRVAIANISDLADKQAELIIDGKFNGLTENLIPPTPPTSDRAGLRLGFKGAQITISALRGEIQTYSTPVSITSSPTEALNQDKVSMGTISARKLRDQIELLYMQYAVHILAAMQAIDVSGCGENYAPFTQKVHNKVREISNMVQDDRELDKDARKIAKWLRNTTIFDEAIPKKCDNTTSEPPHRPFQKDTRPASDKLTLEMKKTVHTLHDRGWSDEIIAQRCKLTILEVEFILDLPINNDEIL